RPCRKAFAPLVRADGGPVGPAVAGRRWSTRVCTLAVPSVQQFRQDRKKVPSRPADREGGIPPCETGGIVLRRQESGKLGPRGHLRRVGDLIPGDRHGEGPAIELLAPEDLSVCGVHREGPVNLIPDGRRRPDGEDKRRARASDVTGGGARSWRPAAHADS